MTSNAIHWGNYAAELVRRFNPKFPQVRLERLQANVSAHIESVDPERRENYTTVAVRHALTDWYSAAKRVEARAERVLARDAAKEAAIVVEDRCIEELTGLCSDVLASGRHPDLSEQAAPRAFAMLLRCVNGESRDALMTEYGLKLDNFYKVISRAKAAVLPKCSAMLAYRLRAAGKPTKPAKVIVGRKLTAPPVV